MLSILTSLQFDVIVNSDITITNQKNEELSSHKKSEDNSDTYSDA